MGAGACCCPTAPPRPLLALRGCRQQECNVLMVLHGCGGLGLVAGEFGRFFSGHGMDPQGGDSYRG